MIAGEPDTYTYRVLLGRLALQYRLPAICYFTDSVEAGALMSYGFGLKAEARRIAAQIVEVLNGGNPAEMPFIQETHFPLVISQLQNLLRRRTMSSLSWIGRERCAKSWKKARGLVWTGSMLPNFAVWAGGT
jgi:ABC transporter substrate binding protein